MKIALNNDWKFAEAFLEEHVRVDFDEATLESVRLPHSAVVTPYNCFDESIYQKVMTYRRIITVDEVFTDQAVKITFEGAAHVAEVYLDGKKIGEHYGGYTAFTLDLTDYISPGKEHLVVVKLNSREDQNLPPFGNVIDYMTYGGLYRGVYLEILPRVHVEDLFIQTERVMETVKKLRVEGTLYNLAEPVEGTFALLDQQGKEVASLGKATISKKTFTVEFDVEDVELWDTESPHLYQLRVVLSNGAIKMETFGFREIQLKNNGLYLNGKKIKIRGLNRHQAYPYVGYAMPETPQKLDADILKYELGLNAVRTSHYPQSKHFINRCDELGLLVFTEIPGWQHIGNEEWKERSLVHVEEMVLQYRNHP
ncbi:MAG TPA: glycoside hydrolase family 2 protein, partial [Treponema sp.]|nr:glycoside hydrolase family 2 protein [Treponema sp.]